MATMELVLSTPIEQLAPKLIAWNNAELLAQVNKSLENYKGKVYDENSIAEAKTDRAALNNFVKSLDSERIRIGKVYAAPYEKFKKEVDEVISFDKICSKLLHLTEDAVRKAVLFDDKIIVTNNNDRFNIDAMGLTEEDIKGIAGIIRGVLKEHNCMFGNELLKGIQSQLPTLYEGIKEFGDRGIRGAIAYKLKEQFRFNSNIICDIGANIDNAEVFKSFAEEERYFSLSALVNLKEQIGVGGVYFDSVNEVASRINANNYVPNGALLFNEDAIDELLERIIIGNQASIKEASNFAIYPSTCQPWTEYLLESYVAKFSKKFKLIHICYAESKCSGAIVKRSSEINSMDDVVVEYLVMHKDIQTANDALNGLVEDGYIARKRYKNIEDLLVVAKAKGRA